ncbi:MAG: ABC transporter ATP-binding protein [Thermodesulfobacteriota bacterium]
MGRTIINLDNVTKTYPGALEPAVETLSLSVERGGITSILGPSGCGKTTSLRLIAGFEKPDSGTITINDRLVAGGSNWVPAENRGVGMVFQDYALFPHLTIRENVAFGLRKNSSTSRRQKVDRVLEIVGLAPFARRYPFELSGGQQQRAALARALAPNPVVILLDEPFSNLDPDIRAQLREEVKRILLDTSSTAILVTHDQEEAFSMAQRVAVLHEGRLEQLGSAEEIYHQPQTRFVAKFVGQTDFVSGWLTAQGVKTELGFFSDLQVGKCGSPGEEVEVMIRPDDVHITPDQDSNGIILRREFKGSENLYTVRLDSGQLLTSSQPSTLILNTGTRVKTWAQPVHVVVFRRKEEAQCDIIGPAQA